MATYVVGDIHGCYDAWMKLKNKIEKQDSQAKFIFVGDIVDRGPQVMEMINWAMRNITPDGKYQMIIGNHEAEKINWWKEYRDNGNSTIDFRNFYPDRYDFQFVMSYYKKTDKEVDEIIEFFKSLPLYKELFIDTGKKKGKQHYIIVHASAPMQCLNKDETFKKSSIHYNKKYNPINLMQVHRNQENIIWYRTYCGNNHLKHTIVVHGHTPTVLDDFEGDKVVKGRAYFRYADINVDCGITYKRLYGRNLCAVRLEDLEEFYVYETGNLMNDEQAAYRNDMKHFIKSGKYINSVQLKYEEEEPRISFKDYVKLFK